jgi:hypothetical protein
MTDPTDDMPIAELNLLLIVYDLARPANGELRKELTRYSSMTQLTDSAWVVRTTRSVAGVFDALDRHLGPDDRLFVGGLNGEAAWRNLEEGYDWLEGAFDPGGPISGRAA